MSRAPSYFEHNARAPELDVVPWDDPGEITVIERALTPEEFTRLKAEVERQYTTGTSGG